MIRRRRPIMRGAMVGGVGYMAGKAGAKRAARESEQAGAAPAGAASAATAGAAPAGAAPAGATPAPGAEPSKLEQLKQLGELRDSGVLTPEEFEREKQRLLGGG
jgi:Short C-terminal domain